MNATFGFIFIFSRIMIEVIYEYSGDGDCLKRQRSRKRHD